MERKTAVICLFMGCLFVGIVVSMMIRGGMLGESNEHPKNWSGKQLTEEEKAEVLRIAFNDTRVKEMLSDGAEYKMIDEPDVMSRTSSKEGKKVTWAYPAMHMHVGKDNWMSVGQIHVLVDLDNKNVIDILEHPIKPLMPLDATGEEREEAIRIALANESVKEKIEGLEYGIVNVVTYEKWMTQEKLDKYDVYLHINGTEIKYIARVNLTEGRVTGISESTWDDKVGLEKTLKASKIAQNDPRIKEKIEGKIKEEDYEVYLQQRLIEKRLVVDVCIEIKEPPERYVATVDTEEWRVIGVWKVARGFFERGKEIK